MKVEVWKPASREEELRSWKKWYFQLSNWLVANDPADNDELAALDVDSPVDHDLMDDAAVARSQKLFGVLCAVVKGRPLLLIRNCESGKNGYEALSTRWSRGKRPGVWPWFASWLVGNFQRPKGFMNNWCGMRKYESTSGNAFP